MATEFRLPKLAEHDETGVVAKVLVGPGDPVALEQSVLEVETEKAVVEVPSDVSGTVAAVHVKQGDEIKEGSLILTTTEDAGTPAQASPESGPARAEEAPAEPPQPVASREAPAQAPISPAQSAPPAEPAAPPAAPAPLVVGPGRRIPAAPSVRRFARELGVDLGSVQGTGPAGRISLEDVKRFVREREERGGSVGPGVLSPEPLPDFTRWGAVRREPMSPVRRATAQHLGRSWPNLPQVTHFDEADVTDLEALRVAHAHRAQERGGKLTMTAILLKVSALALHRFPKFCASIDVAQGEVVFKDYIHIGIAVDTPRGLLVPVVRDVERKTILDLSLELSQIADRARQGKLAREEMQGGCFSISNLGGIGGTGFTPVVNAPEAAILGVSRSRTEPRWDGREFRPREVLPLSLSYDHRLIDGAEAARFLRFVCEVVESPFLLALEG